MRTRATQANLFTGADLVGHSVAMGTTTMNGDYEVANLKAELARERHARIAAEHELVAQGNEAHALRRKAKASQEEIDRLYMEVLTLRATLANNQHQQQRQTSSASLPKDVWRRLTQLCHPDKHNGSKAANTATQWLNANRPA